MRRFTFLFTPALFTPALFTLALGACDVGDTASSVTSQVVGKTVEATKGVADGVKEGVQEGRKDAASVDGSQVLSTAEEVAAATTLSVFSVQAGTDGAGASRAEVVLAVENTTDAPLHLIGLADQGGALVIDKDGFASPLSPLDGGTIQVPPHAKVKTTLTWKGDPGTAASVRVWGQELPVPGGAQPTGATP